MMLYGYSLHLLDTNAMNTVIIERHSDWKCAIVDWDLSDDELDDLVHLAEQRIEPHIFDDDPWRYELEELCALEGCVMREVLY